MALSIGKSYMLRCGLKTSPLRLSNNGTSYRFEAVVQETDQPTPSIFSYLANGRFVSEYVNHPMDIINPDKMKKVTPTQQELKDRLWNIFNFGTFSFDRAKEVSECRTFDQSFNALLNKNHVLRVQDDIFKLNFD